MWAASWNKNSLSYPLMNGERYHAMYTVQLLKFCRSKIILLAVNGIIILSMIESVLYVSPDLSTSQTLKMCHNAIPSRGVL